MELEKGSTSDWFRLVPTGSDRSVSVSVGYWITSSRSDTSRVGWAWCFFVVSSVYIMF